MATEQTPSALLARNTWTNDFTRANGRAPECDYIRLTKTGRVNVTDDVKKATVFTNAQDAQSAIAAREAYILKACKGRNPTGVVNGWAVVAA